VHHQFVVCCEFDVLCKDLEHMMCIVPRCLATCGLRLKIRTVAFISTSQTEKLSASFMCNKFFFPYELPGKVMLNTIIVQSSTSCPCAHH